MRLLVDGVSARRRPKFRDAPLRPRRKGKASPPRGGGDASSLAPPGMNAFGRARGLDGRVSFGYAMFGWPALFPYSAFNMRPASVDVSKAFQALAIVRLVRGSPPVRSSSAPSCGGYELAQASRRSGGKATRRRKCCGSDRLASRLAPPTVSAKDAAQARSRRAGASKLTTGLANERLPGPPHRSRRQRSPARRDSRKKTHHLRGCPRPAARLVMWRRLAAAGALLHATTAIEPPATVPRGDSTSGRTGAGP